MRCDILFTSSCYRRLPKRRPRTAAVTPLHAPCACAQAGIDQVTVQVSASKRLRRVGNIVEAREALEKVRVNKRACVEYAVEDANLSAALLLRDSNNGSKLIAGATNILDVLENSRVTAPAAISAALRVVRAAATLHASQRNVSRALADRAFNLLNRSRYSDAESIGPAVESLAGICAVLGDYREANKFVTLLERRFGYERGEKVRSLLLLAASGAGEVEIASKLVADFEKRGESPPPNAYAALAGAYADAGKHVHALDTLNSVLQMHGPHGVAKNDNLMLGVLRSCERTSDARAARRIYEALKSSNTSPLPNIIRALLRAAFAGGDAKLAETLLLDEINGVADKYKIGQDDLNRMVSAASRSPTLSKRARAIEAQRLFDRAAKVRHAGTGEYNVLIAALARVGASNEARFVVERSMPKNHVRPNIVTYNTLLHACVVAGRPYVALEIFGKMRTQANQVTFNTLINLAAESGEREVLDCVLAEMRRFPDVELGTTAVASILKFYRRERDVESARAVVSMHQKEQRLRGLSPYAELQAVVYMTLLLIYLENNCHAEAISLFGLLVIRRVGGARPYNALLQHHGARRRDSQRALQILSMMKRIGVAPDATSYTIAIRAAARAKKLALAQRLLGEMQDVGAAAADTYAWTAVIDASGHAGQPEVALELFEQMRSGAPGAPHPDIAVYNASIYAVGMNSRSGWRAALRVYNLVEIDGCAPDDVTFSALASVALRHRHRVKERDMVVEIEKALQNRLERLRNEERQRGASGMRRKGPGEMKKLKDKLKRIRWLLDNLGQHGQNDVGMHRRSIM